MAAIDRHYVDLTREVKQKDQKIRKGLTFSIFL
jgi:hypothetical protein